jgi:hypothetical protein
MPYIQRGPKVTSLRGRCAQHLRRIRGFDVRIRRESAAVTQMLCAKSAYDVRHVASVIMQMLRAPRETRDVTF